MGEKIGARCVRFLQREEGLHRSVPHGWLIGVDYLVGVALGTIVGLSAHKPVTRRWRGWWIGSVLSPAIHHASTNTNKINSK